MRRRRCRDVEHIAGHRIEHRLGRLKCQRHVEIARHCLALARIEIGCRNKGDAGNARPAVEVEAREVACADDGDAYGLGHGLSLSH